MLLSKTSEHAIRLVFYLVQNTDGKSYSPIRKIANELNISAFLLSKVAQRLIQAGVLVSSTGPNGGVTLSSNFPNLHLIDVILPIEGSGLLDKCILGISDCSNDNPCPIHHHWKAGRAVLERLFIDLSLADLKTLQSPPFSSIP